MPTEVRLPEVDADDYVEEPFAAKELIARLRSVLRSRRFRATHGTYMSESCARSLIWSLTKTVGTCGWPAGFVFSDVRGGLGRERGHRQHEVLLFPDAVATIEDYD